MNPFCYLYRTSLAILRGRPRLNGRYRPGRSTSLAGIAVLALAVSACDMDYDLGDQFCIMGPCGGGYGGEYTSPPPPENPYNKYYVLGFPHGKIDWARPQDGNYWATLQVGDSVRLRLIRGDSLHTATADSIMRMKWNVADTAAVSIRHISVNEAVLTARRPSRTGVGWSGEILGSDNGWRQQGEGHLQVCWMETRECVRLAFLRIR